jgi:hypothetical protein
MIEAPLVMVRASANRPQTTHWPALNRCGRRERSAAVQQTKIPMRDVTEYRKHAEECRELATPGGSKPEDWGHFLEMVQTWEMLADLHELTGKLKASGALLTKPTLCAE